MRILVDTDVLLDVALDREPHTEASARLLTACESNKIDGFLAWHSLSNFYYLVGTVRGEGDARQFLLDLVAFMSVAPTTTESLRFAGRLAIRDFEDAMQVAAAEACGADWIVTRNVRDFLRSPIRAVTPAAFLRQHSPAK